MESIARVPTNLEKNPHITPSVPPLTAHYKPLLEPLREKRYGDLIPYLQHKVRDKGIVVREAFKDMDVHHNGFVTEAQFRRSFPFPELGQARTRARARTHRIMTHNQRNTQADLNIIVDKFRDPVAGDIHYRGLHEQVMAGQQLLPGDSGHAPWIRVLTPVEKELREYVHARASAHACALARTHV